MCAKEHSWIRINDDELNISLKISFITKMNAISLILTVLTHTLSSYLHFYNIILLIFNLLPSHILKSIEELYELPDPDERPTHGGGRPADRPRGDNPSETSIATRGLEC